MKDTHAHTHHCNECGKPYLCEGEQFQNPDGWPETVCRVFHVAALNQCPACVARLEEEPTDDMPERRPM